MKKQYSKNLAILMFASAMVFLSSSITNAQGMYSSSSGGWSTGYGTVYGSHGYALATQDMYRVMQKQMNENMMRNSSGSASSSRTKNAGSSVSSASTAVVPPRVARNHGVFRPDATVDTGKALADNLAGTPEEKALIRKIYAGTKSAYEKEAALRGWKNNIAAGLTFFTVAAMTVYHDAEAPSDDAVNNYFKAVNSALDEMPELGSAANKNKQAYNNMLIGFSGMLLAGYSEAKQNNDAELLATSKKLAEMLIKMILKTDPENLRLENGQIVLK